MKVSGLYRGAKTLMASANSDAMMHLGKADLPIFLHIHTILICAILILYIGSSDKIHATERQGQGANTDLGILLDRSSEERNIFTAEHYITQH